jgi:hypothetical protein
MELERADRDVAAAVADLRALGSSVDWDAHRHVSGQRGLREIEEQSASPLRDAVASWITWLTVARVSQAAEQRRDAALADARAVVRLERDAEVDVRGIVTGLLGAKTAGEARAWAIALPEAAAKIEEPERTLRETRAEAFRRLGVDDVSARFTGVPASTLVASARELIASTDDLAREVVSRGEPWPLDLPWRLGRDAKEGWPSRLTWRTAAGLLPGLTLRATMKGDPPKALGASSFARALAAIGAVFHHETRQKKIEPFSMREPPLDPRPIRAGFALASALGERAMHARVLGLASGRAADQARAVAASFLLAMRADAFRVAQRGGDVDDLADRVFGAHLRWPSPADEDFPRFVAGLCTQDVVSELREREGDDWFRNPRAFATLAGMSGAPATIPEGAVARLVRRFEAGLG